MMLLRTIKLMLLSAWIALVPIHPALISVMCLPIADLALALLCARKNKEAITSSGLKRTVAKVLMYEAAVILAFVTETTLLGSLVPAVKMITALIGITELKSCLEHLDILGGAPFFASILNKLAPPKDDKNE